MPFYRHTPRRPSVEKSSYLAAKTMTLWEELRLVGVMILLGILTALINFSDWHYDFIKHFCNVSVNSS